MNKVFYNKLKIFTSDNSNVAVGSDIYNCHGFFNTVY